MNNITEITRTDIFDLIKDGFVEIALPKHNSELRNQEDESFRYKMTYFG